MIIGNVRMVLKMDASDFDRSRDEWERLFGPLDDGARLRQTVRLIRLRSPWNRVRASVIQCIWPTEWSNLVLADETPIRAIVRTLIFAVALGCMINWLTR